MALWGKGDPRWIVEQRPDATNVNNWHWVEKNATAWSQTRLKELLANKTLANGPLKVVFKELSKLEGEASANNRKAKLIFLFEWTIIIDFEATIAGSETLYKGTVEILNLSDENEANEIQISCQVTNPGPHENQILAFLNSEGLVMIRAELEKYITELKKEFSQGLILPTEKRAAPGCTQANLAIATENSTRMNKKEFQNNIVVDETRKTAAVTAVKSDAVPTTNFELVHCFKVPPDRLFEILTDPSLVNLWCPNSSIDAKEGVTFSMLGELVTGTFASVQPDKHIAMKWRLRDYPANVYANLKLTLCDKSDSVDLQVKADDVPETNAQKTKEFINRYFFSSLGVRFGITLPLI